MAAAYDRASVTNQSITLLPKKVKPEYYFLADRLLEIIPDTCWKTEKTLAAELSDYLNARINTRDVKYAKAILEMEGEVHIARTNNGKRSNPVHTIRKVFPISNIKKEGSRIVTADAEWNIKWDELTKYSASEFNSLSNYEQAEIYMAANIIVLPTAYPTIIAGKLACSCWYGEKCAAIGKHPLVRYKNVEKYYDQMKEKWLLWWKNNPKLNLGAKVFGFSVIDLDFKSLRPEEFAVVEDELGEVETELIASSGNGEHRYVTNKGLKNNVGLLSGLDTRSCGGFIVLPPSQHKSGNKYQWKSIGEVGTLTDDWVVNIVKSGEERKTNLGTNGNSTGDVAQLLRSTHVPERFEAGYTIPEGQRWSVLFKLASRERGRGADAERLYDILTTVNETFCIPSMEDKEIEHIVRYVSQYPTEAEKLFGRKS